jgi:GNAT superfamily N-acetyltransferase
VPHPGSHACGFAAHDPRRHRVGRLSWPHRRTSLHATHVFIRPASIDDAAAIATLVGELGYSAGPDDIKARLPLLLDSDRYFLAVATTSDGRLLGLVNAERRLNIESGTSFELTGLVVASCERRSGVGSALVAAAEAWARARGATSMRVRSNVVRPEAHAFYARLGYGLQKTQHCYSRPLPA